MRVYVVLPLFFLLFGFLLPLKSHALTLEEAVEKALAENPALKEVQYLTETSRQAVKSARGDFLPTITLNAQASRSEKDIDSGVATKSHPKFAQIQMTQSLFAGGENVAHYQSARQTFKSVKMSELQSLQTLILQVVTVYMNVLKEKDVLSLKENQVAVLQTQYLATKARFESGDVTKTDLKQAEARLFAAKAENVRAQGALDSARFALRNVLGPVDEKSLTWPNMSIYTRDMNVMHSDLPVSKIGIPLTPAQESLFAMATSGADPFAQPDLWQALEQEIVSTHPLYQSALFDVRSTGYDVKKATSSFLPNVDANLSYGQYDDFSGQDYEDKTATISLSLPLFRGGKSLSEVRSARAFRDAANARLEQAKRDVTEELVDALRGYQTAHSSLDSYTKAYDASKIASQGVRKEAVFGERSVLDVLDTEQDYLEAAVGLESAKADVVVSTFRLLMALGALTSVPSLDVEGREMWLDDVAHVEEQEAAKIQDSARRFTPPSQLDIVKSSK